MTNDEADTRVHFNKLQWLSLICWMIFIIGLIIFHYARPSIDYGYMNYKGIAPDSRWHQLYVPWFLGAMWLCVGVTFIDVLVRIITRSRRRHLYNLCLLLLMLMGFLGSYYVGIFFIPS